MNRLRIILILLVALTVRPVLGQQQFVFTNYLLNQYYYNPALAGSQNFHTASLGYRNQWVGF